MKKIYCPLPGEKRIPRPGKDVKYEDVKTISISSVTSRCSDSVNLKVEDEIEDKPLPPKDADSTFPWHILPPGMETIVMDWKDSYGLQPLYTFSAMLGACSSALGNRVKLRLNTQWYVTAPLWIMSVGNPGTGKSSPVKSVYQPLYENDAELYKQFRDDYSDWIANKQQGPCPQLHQVVLSDFTPESLWREHGRNASGIAVVVDELKGLLDSANRYNQGALVPQLLSAYSGSPIKITRKGEELPTLIEDTCVGIFGTIQPGILFESMTKDLIDNGFMDRWLIMWPDYQQCPKWTMQQFMTSCNTARTQKPTQQADTLKVWQGVMERILKMGHRSSNVAHVSLCAGAIRLYVEHHNRMTGLTQHGELSTFMSNRKHKQGTTVGKLALTFEVISRALKGFETVQEVSEEAMRCAIDVYDWMEERTELLMQQQPSRKREKEERDNAYDDMMQLLTFVALDFERSDVLKAGREELKMGRAKVDSLIKLAKETGMVTTKTRGKFLKTDKYIELQLDSIA